MAASMLLSDGSGLGKNSPGRTEKMLTLYAMSSLLVQFRPDLADRMSLAIAKSEDMIRIQRKLGWRNVLCLA
jgi:hypothetical protein